MSPKANYDLITNPEPGTWVVSCRCENCHAYEASHDKDPMTLRIKQSEQLFKECQNRMTA